MPSPQDFPLNSIQPKKPVLPQQPVPLQMAPSAPPKMTETQRYLFSSLEVNGLIRQQNIEQQRVARIQAINEGKSRSGYYALPESLYFNHIIPTLPSFLGKEGTIGESVI